MSDFQAILLEGLFYDSEEPYPDANGVLRDGFNDLLVRPDSGAVVSVYKTLKPLIGQRVQFAVHQLPNNPPDMTRWGGGSCFWQEAGRCPFGHHENPHMLFNVSGQGFLVYDLDHTSGSGGWWLERADGGKEMLPLAHALLGHRGRVASATAMSVEQMRDSLMASGDLDDIEGIGNRVNDLKDLLAGLGRAVKGD
jgi:hypothetical protein